LVTLTYSVLKIPDFVRGFLYLVLSVVCPCLETVYVVVLLRVQSILVAFEVLEVAENLLIVTLCFRLELGSVVDLLDHIVVFILGF